MTFIQWQLQQCIFKGHEHDAGECSFYLFPEDITEHEEKIEMEV